MTSFCEGKGHNSNVVKCNCYIIHRNSHWPIGLSRTRSVENYLFGVISRMGSVIWVIKVRWSQSYRRHSWLSGKNPLFLYTFSNLFWIKNDTAQYSNGVLMKFEMKFTEKCWHGSSMEVFWEYLHWRCILRIPPWLKLWTMLFFNFLPKIFNRYKS